MFKKYRTTQTPPARPQPEPVTPAVAMKPPAARRPTSEEQADARRRRRLLDLRVTIHQRLLESLNLGAIEDAPIADLRQEIAAISRETLTDIGVVVNAQEFESLVNALVDEVTGLGPLEPLLKDPTVTDILVNTHEQCFVERFGRLELTEVQFKDERHLMRVIDKIVSAVGRRVDESQPWVDARLKDGSRVNAMIPPCAVDGPLLSIRKFSRTPFDIEKLIEFGTLSGHMAQYLQAVVSTRLNVLVSGGTGSGKTTNLNALSAFIANNERIVTIEDTAELQLQQMHVGRMESRPPNIEGKGEINQRDLLRNALRMRPDRIIVGEVRGGEVLDMLQAMNTGHDGSMTTIHANNPRDALGRVENMVSMSGIDMPMKAVRTQIAAAIQVVVQVSRLSDGARRMVSIQEITGMDGDIVTMQEIFRFDQQTIGDDGSVIGEFTATGIRSHFAERFARWGIKLPQDIFIPAGRKAG
ncbi:CpaF family protein [Pikeienuella piscinae]|uniref:CpaF family protein n=1 Tax=Pikeienuella piscinae TaxID=2748098 RepID=A0A7M3T5E2_9RHOB|nr:CpaF family protein [Pikeienuella piscinae]QIE57223.1 CpaF family protein [Pikeienuella piscinae]